jgi:hypothetical protein
MDHSRARTLPRCSRAAPTFRRRGSLGVHAEHCSPRALVGVGSSHQAAASAEAIRASPMLGVRRRGRSGRAGQHRHDGPDPSHSDDTRSGDGRTAPGAPGDPHQAGWHRSITPPLLYPTLGDAEPVWKSPPPHRSPKGRSVSARANWTGAARAPDAVLGQSQRRRSVVQQTWTRPCAGSMRVECRSLGPAPRRR